MRRRSRLPGGPLEFWGWTLLGFLFLTISMFGALGGVWEWVVLGTLNWMSVLVLVAIREIKEFSG